MPTPHGSRGGMAFSADEVRVLRRALAQALHPTVPAQLPLGADLAVLWAEDVQEALRLAEAIDEAVLEGGRLRGFLLAELARYRAALPGTARGYLERLEEAVADGYLPEPDDLSALRTLTRQPCGPGERTRRSRLAGRCHALAEAAVRERLARTTVPPARHLTAVPSPDRSEGTSMTSEPRRPAPAPAPTPARIPTPAELFARRPRPPQHREPPQQTEDHEEDEPQELATGTG
ncbi:hypothetical protein P3T35_000577 [Kitasatospora sp. GP30]|uniref:hypothetical protein n=1 Tax=Kitasatospora sp. GP30 TaxID=3035084 RepID=UPI000C70989B|nr:hypothetical protein [Kitasatospora sp. GP30]MDH6138600.1 hypothetical protein [Kitasatospora sp. GP30]